MKSTVSILFFIVFYASTSIAMPVSSWQKLTYKQFDFYYTQNDKQSINEYRELISSGIQTVEKFFNSPFQKRFAVFIHPGRKSLDSTWSKDWNTPGFTSECWMVASGIAKRIDIISPKEWDKESCEHNYNDKEQTQRLITHELFHVYHGQLNASSDFSNVDNIDWFVEGLATYASGQLDSARIKEVAESVHDKTIPVTLDKFWTGKLKYALSGSVVMFIDKKYGRQKLKLLLRHNKKSEILNELAITEENLLSEWNNYMESLNTNNHQQSITGEYYLRGVMETASGFLLNPDSTFQFFFSYGAVDRYGSGTWSLSGNKIIFNSNKKPGQDFKMLSSKKLNNEFITIKIIDSNTYLLNHVYGALQYTDTTLGDVSDQNGEIKILRKSAEKISLTFEFCPEKTSVFPIDKNMDYFEFKFEPWMAEVFFTDFALTFTGNELTGKHPLLDEKIYHYEKEK